jgi:hypothetical protein
MQGGSPIASCEVPARLSSHGFTTPSSQRDGGEAGYAVSNTSYTRDVQYHQVPTPAHHDARGHPILGLQGCTANRNTSVSDPEMGSQPVASNRPHAVPPPPPRHPGDPRVAGGAADGLSYRTGGESYQAGLTKKERQVHPPPALLQPYWQYAVSEPRLPVPPPLPAHQQQALGHLCHQQQLHHHYYHQQPQHPGEHPQPLSFQSQAHQQLHSQPRSHALLDISASPPPSIDSTNGGSWAGAACAASSGDNTGGSGATSAAGAGAAGGGVVPLFVMMMGTPAAVGAGCCVGLDPALRAGTPFPGDMPPGAMAVHFPHSTIFPPMQHPWVARFGWGGSNVKGIVSFENSCVHCMATVPGIESRSLRTRSVEDGDDDRERGT